MEGTGKGANGGKAFTSMNISDAQKIHQFTNVNVFRASGVDAVCRIGANTGTPAWSSIPVVQPIRGLGPITALFLYNRARKELMNPTNSSRGVGRRVLLFNKGIELWGHSDHQLT